MRSAPSRSAQTIHPAGFDELMPKTLAAATVDRLLHHAHVILTDRQESYHLAQATTGKGLLVFAERILSTAIGFSPRAGHRFSPPCRGSGLDVARWR